MKAVRKTRQRLGLIRIHAREWKEFIYGLCQRLTTNETERLLSAIHSQLLPVGIRQSKGDIELFIKATHYIRGGGFHWIIWSGSPP